MRNNALTVVGQVRKDGRPYRPSNPMVGVEQTAMVPGSRPRPDQPPLVTGVSITAAENSTYPFAELLSYYEFDLVQEPYSRIR